MATGDGILSQLSEASSDELDSEVDDTLSIISSTSGSGTSKTTALSECGESSLDLGD